MPKLRNADNDIDKFAQWLGRKCRNHNPLEELKLDITSRQKLPSMHQAKGKGDVQMLEAARNTLIYDVGGRVFAIEVNELEGEQIEAVRKAKKIAVGY